MGKDPSAVVLATALAFCAFCPFFARCDDTEVNDIKNGIESWLKVQVKYQAEFDRKVKFVELQDAIDEIDTVMLGYKGKAKAKLPLIRSLNSEARLTYQNCVGPVFEWCISVNSTFDIFIDKIGKDKIEINGNIIWNKTVSTLKKGINEAQKCSECFIDLPKKIAELDYAIKDMLLDVLNDFGPGGFYGEEKAELQKRIKGSSLGWFAALATFGITEIVNWKQKQTYKEQIELMEHFFTEMRQRIENATKIMEDMESNLEEEKQHFYKLQVVIIDADWHKLVLLSDRAILRVQFISDIKDLKDSCAKYVNWHGFDEPFYHKISS